MGYGIWDMGYGIWDMGYGIWDMGYGIRDAGRILDDLIPISRREGGVLIGDAECGSKSSIIKE